MAESIIVVTWFLLAGAIVLAVARIIRVRRNRPPRNSRTHDDWQLNPSQNTDAADILEEATEAIEKARVAIRARIALENQARFRIEYMNRIVAEFSPIAEKSKETSEDLVPHLVYIPSGKTKQLESAIKMEGFEAEILRLKAYKRSETHPSLATNYF